MRRRYAGTSRFKMQCLSLCVSPSLSSQLCITFSLWLSLTLLFSSSGRCRRVWPGVFLPSAVFFPRRAPPRPSVCVSESSSAVEKCSLAHVLCQFCTSNNKKKSVQAECVLARVTSLPSDLCSWESESFNTHTHKWHTYTHIH